MKLKTKKRLARKGKALQRSGSSWNGMYKILQLLARSDVNECSGIRQVVPSFQALEIIAETGKI